MKLEQYMNIIEAILFSSIEPLSYKRIAKLIDLTESDVKDLLNKLQDYYIENKRGIQLYFFKDKVQIGSNPLYIEYLKKMISSSKKKGISDAAMEVLSIIAYKQPITKNEIEYVRGINADRLIHQLIDRYLIEEKGRLDKIGRPKIYGTTDIFLRNFGLKSLKDLPMIDFELLKE